MVEASMSIVKWNLLGFCGWLWLWWIAKVGMVCILSTGYMYLLDIGGIFFFHVTLLTPILWTSLAILDLMTRTEKKLGLLTFATNTTNHITASRVQSPDYRQYRVATVHVINSFNSIFKINKLILYSASISFRHHDKSNANICRCYLRYVSYVAWIFIFDR